MARRLTKSQQNQLGREVFQLRAPVAAVLIGIATMATGVVIIVLFHRNTR